MSWFFQSPFHVAAAIALVAVLVVVAVVLRKSWEKDKNVLYEHQGKRQEVDKASFAHAMRQTICRFVLSEYEPNHPAVLALEQALHTYDRAYYKECREHGGDILEVLTKIEYENTTTCMNVINTDVKAREWVHDGYLKPLACQPTYVPQQDLSLFYSHAHNLIFGIPKSGLEHYQNQLLCDRIKFEALINDYLRNVYCSLVADFPRAVVPIYTDPYAYKTNATMLTAGSRR